MNSWTACAMTRPEPKPVVYIDSCVYLDLLGKNREKHKDTQQPRWESAKAVLDAVNTDRVVLAASALIEAEVNCLAVVRDGAQAIHDRVRGWFTAASTLWTDVDRFLARDAAKLAQRYQQYVPAGKKLGGADATHLAAAVRLGCTHLMTHDEAFPIGHVVNGVQVMRPAEVWPRDLLDEIAEKALAVEKDAEKKAAASKKSARKMVAPSKPKAIEASKSEDR
jgi:predicted nucleic acid-binding protein